eukprot:12654038-Alexandrium_andersonii.AAC.1
MERQDRPSARSGGSASEAGAGQGRHRLPRLLQRLLSDPDQPGVPQRIQDGGQVAKKDRAGNRLGRLLPGQRGRPLDDGPTQLRRRRRADLRTGLDDRVSKLWVDRQVVARQRGT